MTYKKIFLKENDPEVYLEAYIADAVGQRRNKALLVLPGGGYGSVCSDREGEPIALAFLPYGYNAFVLHYTVGRKAPYPTQLREVALAIGHIKDHAYDYHIDPSKVFGVGFSAGGHLVASAGVFWKRPEVTEGLDMPEGYHRLAGIMPIYPVINSDGHNESFRNLLCDDHPAQADMDYLAVDKYVDSDSAPAFIVHTADDQVVDARNSLALAMAYADAKVSYELHIFPHAPHGVALGNAVTDCGSPDWNDPMIAKWVEMAAYWAEKLCK